MNRETTCCLFLKHSATQQRREQTIALHGSVVEHHHHSAGQKTKEEGVQLSNETCVIQEQASLPVVPGYEGSFSEW